jgi:hypothetical protein
VPENTFALILPSGEIAVLAFVLFADSQMNSFSEWKRK